MQPQDQRREDRLAVYVTIGIHMRRRTMTAFPFISVIIPHLNQPEELRRCLESLQVQSYPADRFETIVVDNGSSELPVAVTDGFDRVRLISEGEPGPGPARNCGVAASSGEILAFIDADCIADSRWLEALAKALTGPGGARIVGGDVRIALAVPGRTTWLEAYESVFAYQQRMYIEKKGFSGTGNLAVWRSVHDLVGPFAGIEVSEDRDWGRRTRAKGLTIAFVPEMVVFHPARASLANLREKWSRQLRHDLEEWRRAGRSSAAWILRALAVAGSPVRDVPRTLISDRISGLGPRFRAASVLVYLRLFRAAQMICLLTLKTENRSALFWNRPEGKAPSSLPPRTSDRP